LSGTTTSERRVIELTKANFRRVVGTERVVLIECWAPGCGACAKFDPIFQAVAERHPAHVFARMNVNTDDQLGEFFEIGHTPTLMLYRDGLLLLKQPGIYGVEELEDVVRQAASLDMDVVRTDLQAEKPAARDAASGTDADDAAAGRDGPPGTTSTTTPGEAQ
jgi:thioredoxin 1